MVPLYSRECHRNSLRGTHARAAPMPRLVQPEGGISCTPPSVTKARTGKAEELATRIKEGAIPIISDVEGFMAYYVVYAPDDTVTAISVFNNFASAEEANRRALAWAEQNLAPLLIGPATAVAGPVIVHTLA
jgi:hypothetical protein